MVLFPTPPLILPTKMDSRLLEIIMKVVHILGNGDNHSLYKEKPRKGLHLTCNVAPFAVPNHLQLALLILNL